MAKPVRPGIGTIHCVSQVLEPEKPIGTLFADPIRASSPKRLHTQAGQTTAPDRPSDFQKSACNAGAIHRRHACAPSSDRNWADC
jgi:hypothetical protein